MSNTNNNTNNNTNSSANTISDYFSVQKGGITGFQTLLAYLGGSVFQTVIDNPITSYRQLVQQYAKDSSGNVVDPRVARAEANAVFYRYPVSSSFSGLSPRLIGICAKRVSKFSLLLGFSYLIGEDDIGIVAATVASILSAPLINPVRMIEKQQRTTLRLTGKQQTVFNILRESSHQNFAPLFRGTVPLMGHSFASATTGLVGQPQLQKYIQGELGSHTNMSRMTANLVASSIVSPIYVVMTNPLSRLEVIMQTASIKSKSLSLREAIGELVSDSKKFGLRGTFRGQGIGIAKAIVSLTTFHEGRMWMINYFKRNNTMSTHRLNAAT